jgi:predicted kinase
MKAFVLIGPPGSGKTTYSAKLSTEQNAVILSGDSVREELYGDIAIQGDWGEIWERLEELVAENVGRVLIFDGTHCRVDYRKETMTLLQSYGYTEIEGIVLRTPLEVCLRQNSQRSRKVPEHVIRQMHSDLQNSLKNIDTEDFDSINYVL